MACRQLGNLDYGDIDGICNAARVYPHRREQRSAGHRPGLLREQPGRWDDAAHAHVDVGISERSSPVQDGFGAVGAFHPAATRVEVGRLAVPVLAYAGELDASPTPGTAAAGARLFPNATETVQPGAAHFRGSTIRSSSPQRSPHS